MIDYGLVVEELRSFVQSNVQTCSERLKKLAADYVEACGEVNGRLRRCEDYLQQGLRSEAIQFADGEPPLLEAVSLLDFPERLAWEEVCFRYALPGPPKLLVKTAEALNKAYSEEQPLAVLLKQHRRLALCRAPLRDRLAVMRQIARLDLGSPFWSEDIAALQKARLQQIEEEWDQAKSAQDVDSVLVLWEELEQTAWIAEPPARFLNACAAEIARHKQRQVRRSLEKAAAGLSQALAASDEAAAREAREVWLQLALEADGSSALDDKLRRLVSPALQWLAQLDRRQSRKQAYEDDVQALESALAGGAAEEELQELYSAVKGHKVHVPDDLTDRYLQRIESLRVSSSRRERYIVAATFAFGVLILVVLILFLSTRTH